LSALDPGRSSAPTMTSLGNYKIADKQSPRPFSLGLRSGRQIRSSPCCRTATAPTPTRFRSEGSADAVAGAPFLCRAIAISDPAPGTTCGNHRANSPRHLRAHSGMLFAVQTREPTRRSASSSVQHSMRSSSSRAGHMAKCVFPRSPAPRNEGHTTPRVRQLPSVTWRLATRTRAEGPHGCDGARRPHSRRRDEP
jgi:hypothetical protein